MITVPLSYKFPSTICHLSLLRSDKMALNCLVGRMNQNIVFVLVSRASVKNWNQTTFNCKTAYSSFL